MTPRKLLRSLPLMLSGSVLLLACASGDDTATTASGAGGAMGGGGNAATTGGQGGAGGVGGSGGGAATTGSTSASAGGGMMCDPGLTLCGADCIDTAIDPANCGGCGTACGPLANATPVCAGGACGIGSCNAGFGNCDGLAANGCEVNTNQTVAHCGACGNACPALPNGMVQCMAGACGIASCNAGFGNCDGLAANGCEVNTNETVAHCGGCGNVCPALANGMVQCMAGACGIASCNAGFGNCDGLAANGCEVNLAISPVHCGACGNACGANKACVAGTCVSF